MNEQQKLFISKVRQLERKATPAPWSRYGDNIEDARKVPLVTVTKDHFDDENAEFITALRNAVPQLLLLIEQQEREIMQLKEPDGTRSGTSATKSSTFLQ